MVKKHLIGLFLNDGTSSAPVWKRIKKSTELTISMNPETEDFDYIADENPTTELMKYKPSIDQDLTMYKGEPDYDMMWPYFYEARTGSEAHKECMIAFMQEGSPTTGYAAWKTDAVISVQDLNAVESKLNFQVLFGGDLKKGLATKTGDTIAFTEGGTISGPSVTAPNEAVDISKTEEP